MTLADASELVRTVLGRVELLDEVGRGEDALALVVATLREEPDDARLLLSAASLCLGLRRTDEALRYAQAVVAVAPDLAVAHLLASVALLDLGDARGARSAVERCLALDPDDAAAHGQHAYVLLAGRPRAADKARARAASGRSLELSPEDPRVLYDAAMIRNRLGSQDEARGLVLRGLELAPEDADLLVALARLTPDGTASLDGVLADNPMHAEAGLLLHHQVWQQMEGFGRVAVRVGTLALVLVGAVMSDRGIGFAPSCAVVLMVLLVVGSVRAQRGLRRTSRPYLERSFRAGGRPTRAAFALTVAGLVGVLAAVVGLFVVQDAVSARYLVVLAAVSVLLAGAGRTILTPSLYLVGRAQGLYPDSAAGADQLEHARRHVRRAVLARFVVVVLVAVVVVGRFPATGRTDALAAALLGATMFLSPSVAAWWAIERMLRTGSVATASAPGGLSRVALVASAVLVLLSGVVGLVQVPVGANAYDAHGRYVRPADGPDDDPASCGGAASGPCADVHVPPGVDVPTFDPPPVDIPTFDVPDIDLGALDPTPPADAVPDRDVPVTTP